MNDFFDSIPINKTTILAQYSDAQLGISKKYDDNEPKGDHAGNFWKQIPEQEGQNSKGIYPWQGSRRKNNFFEKQRHKTLTLFNQEKIQHQIDHIFIDGKSMNIVTDRKVCVVNA